MEVDSSENKPVPLPSAKPVQLGHNVLLHAPLSRRGKGPALLIVTPSEYLGHKAGDPKKTIDPEPLQKWAEEGFAVVEVKVGSSFQTFKDGCTTGIEALQSLPECTYDGKLAVIGTSTCCNYDVLIQVENVQYSPSINSYVWRKCDFD